MSSCPRLCMLYAVSNEPKHSCPAERIYSYISRRCGKKCNARLACLLLAAGSEACTSLHWIACCCAVCLQECDSQPHDISCTSAGLVETSTNLASVRAHAANNTSGPVANHTTYTIVCCTRSSLMPALETVRQRIAKLARLCGAGISLDKAYPGWQPAPSSPVVTLTKEVIGSITGKEPKVWHAPLQWSLAVVYHHFEPAQAHRVVHHGMRHATGGATWFARIILLWHSSKRARCSFSIYSMAGSESSAVSDWSLQRQAMAYRQCHA